MIRRSLLTAGATSQRVTVRESPLAVAIVSPSGEKAIASSLPVTQIKGRPRPDSSAHSVTAPNGAPSKPVPRPAMTLPSGANATASTSSHSPRSVRLSLSLPLRASQSLIVPSQLPLARVRPSGEKATEVTTLLWLTWRLALGLEVMQRAISLSSLFQGNAGPSAGRIAGLLARAPSARSGSVPTVAWVPRPLSNDPSKTARTCMLSRVSRVTPSDARPYKRLRCQEVRVLV